MSTIRFEYSGYRECKSVCQLEISREICLVICTELVENQGTSITNMAAPLATLVCAEMNIDPLELIWVERYTHESYGQSEASFRAERKITEGLTEDCSLGNF